MGSVQKYLSQARRIELYEKQLGELEDAAEKSADRIALQSTHLKALETGLELFDKRHHRAESALREPLMLAVHAVAAPWPWQRWKARRQLRALMREMDT